MPLPGDESRRRRPRVVGVAPPRASSPAATLGRNRTGRVENRVNAALMNLPNQLTALRLILSLVLFVLVVWEWYGAALGCFLAAAATDWLDGYLARKWGQVTTLGRILDPFADKVVVCGTFILLAAVPAITRLPLGLRAWMVVVIVGRELLVTALRSFLEQRGSDFSAKMSGKLKMALQCVAAAFCLYYLAAAYSPDEMPDWVRVGLVGSVWAAVVLTIYSGVVYIHAALRLLRASET